MDLRFRHGVGDDNLLCVLKAMEGNLERPLPCARLAKTTGVSLQSRFARPSPAPFWAKGLRSLESHR
jgi:transcriptional regulator GlxA family with amidase domain